MVEEVETVRDVNGVAEVDAQSDDVLLESQYNFN